VNVNRLKESNVAHTHINTVPLHDPVSRLYYYNDKWQVMCEYTTAGTVAGYYIYGNYIDEVLCMYGLGLFKFFVHDHLYSPVALIGVGTTVLERYEYDAYGQPTIWDATFSTKRTSSLYANPYMFTGRRVDMLDSGSLKIQYNRNRYYDYYMGRWFTQDPMGYVDGLNLYEYVRSDPMLFTDPSGTDLNPIHIQPCNWDIEKTYFKDENCRCMLRSVVKLKEPCRVKQIVLPMFVEPESMTAKILAFLKSKPGKVIVSITPVLKVVEKWVSLGTSVSSLSKAKYIWDLYYMEAELVDVYKGPTCGRDVSECPKSFLYYEDAWTEKTEYKREWYEHSHGGPLPGGGGGAVGGENLYFGTTVSNLKELTQDSALTLTEIALEILKKK